MVSKDAERDFARCLRVQGMSLNEITARVGVSKSSVSIWVRDIRLTPEQADALVIKQRVNASRVNGWSRDAKVARWAAFHRQADAEYPLLCRDPEFMYGLALYVGEGGKSSPNTANLTNCDPRVIRRAIRFFEQIGALRDQITCQIFFHADCDREAVRQFWRDQTGLAVDAHLIRSVSRSSKGTKPGAQPYGTCRISVHSTQLRQKIERWMELSLRG